MTWTVDPIRERLDELRAEKHRRDDLLDRAYPRGPGGQAIFPDETEWPFDALRAVLDEIDHAPRTPTAQLLARCVRKRIADVIGVGRHDPWGGPCSRVARRDPPPLMPPTHVLPESAGDGRMHVLDDRCWCGPLWTFNGDGVVRLVHTPWE